MATSRLFYQNLLTQQNFGGFSVAGGAVEMATSTWGSPYFFKAGTAGWTGTGTYTGAFEANYMVEIHLTDGTFPGTRWRWSDTGGAVWNQQNLTPVSGVPVSLNNGLSMTFTTLGPGPQFVINDRLENRAIRPYGIAKALDGSRNTEYRSGTTPGSSTIRLGWDLGFAQQPQFVVLEDHNIPVSGVVTLFGGSTLFNESSGFGSQVIPPQVNRMSALVTVAPFRYWWVRVVMPAGGQPAYLRLSGLGLWNGVTFALPPVEGMSEDDQFLGSFDLPNVASRGPSPRLYSAAMPQRTWQSVKRDPTEDGGKLEAVYEYAKTHASYTMPPFYFIPLDTDLTRIELNGWAGDLGKRHQFKDRWDFTTNWVAIIRTVAS